MWRQVQQRRHRDNDAKRLFCSANICNLPSARPHQQGWTYERGSGWCSCVCINNANPLCCVARRRNEMHLLPGDSSGVCASWRPPTVVFLPDPIGSSLVWRGLCRVWHWRIGTRRIYSYGGNKDASLFISLWICLIVIFTARVVVVTLNLHLLLGGWNAVPADIIKTSSEP